MKDPAISLSEKKVTLWFILFLLSFLSSSPRTQPNIVVFYWQKNLPPFSFRYSQIALMEELEWISKAECFTKLSCHRWKILQLVYSRILKTISLKARRAARRDYFEKEEDWEKVRPAYHYCLWSKYDKCFCWILIDWTVRVWSLCFCE